MSKQKRLSAFLWVNSVTSSCLSGQADCYSAGLFPSSGGRILPFLWSRCKERIFALKQEQIEKGDGVEKCSGIRPFSSAFLEVRRGFFFQRHVRIAQPRASFSTLTEDLKMEFVCLCLYGCMWFYVGDPLCGVRPSCGAQSLDSTRQPTYATAFKLFCWATASRKWRSESCSFQEE